MSASNPSTPTTTNSTPQLSPVARDKALAISRTFQVDLVAVSQTIASHGGFNYIDEPHVIEALTTLRRAGLRRSRWFWQRPDFRVGAGGILAGLGPTVGSVAKDVIESYGELSKYPVCMWIFMIGIPFLIVVGGVFLAVWGWLDNDRN
ncbi:MAG: hypothetical protein L0211_02580 [Planctomycetaceae bacterium]|nr:hypothetical protein [Planctomycetaceae bacterium]